MDVMLLSAEASGQSLLHEQQRVLSAAPFRSRPSEAWLPQPESAPKAAEAERGARLPSAVGPSAIGLSEAYSPSFAEGRTSSRTDRGGHLFAKASSSRWPSSMSQASSMHASTSARQQRVSSSGVCHAWLPDSASSMSTLSSRGGRGNQSLGLEPIRAADGSADGSASDGSTHPSDSGRLPPTPQRVLLTSRSLGPLRPRRLTPTQSFDSRDDELDAARCSALSVTHRTPAEQNVLAAALAATAEGHTAESLPAIRTIQALTLAADQEPGLASHPSPQVCPRADGVAALQPVQPEERSRASTRSSSDSAATRICSRTDGVAKFHSSSMQQWASPQAVTLEDSEPPLQLQPSTAQIAPAAAVVPAAIPAERNLSLYRPDRPPTPHRRSRGGSCGGLGPEAAGSGDGLHGGIRILRRRPRPGQEELVPAAASAAGSGQGSDTAKGQMVMNPLAAGVWPEPQSAKARRTKSSSGTWRLPRSSGNDGSGGGGAGSARSVDAGAGSVGSSNVRPVLDRRSGAARTAGDAEDGRDNDSDRAGGTLAGSLTCGLWRRWSLW